jgi:pyruvate/2-oxoglutarate/acetoin dehydrogenase E1 component
MFGDFIALVMDQFVNHAAKVHYLFADVGKPFSLDL